MGIYFDGVYISKSPVVRVDNLRETNVLFRRLVHGFHDINKTAKE